jgi:hypothetical protein
LKSPPILRRILDGIRKRGGKFPANGKPLKESENREQHGRKHSDHFIGRQASHSKCGKSHHQSGNQQRPPPTESIAYMTKQ